MQSTPENDIRELIHSSGLSDEEKQAILELDEAAIRLPLTIENFRLQHITTEPNPATPDEN